MAFGAKVAGTPARVAPVESVQEIPVSDSLPELLISAEMLIGCPGAEAFVQLSATVMAGAVRILHDALELADTALVLMAPFAVQVTVSAEGLAEGV